MGGACARVCVRLCVCVCVRAHVGVRARARTCACLCADAHLRECAKPGEARARVCQGGAEVPYPASPKYCESACSRSRSDAPSAKAKRSVRASLSFVNQRDDPVEGVGDGARVGLSVGFGVGANVGGSVGVAVGSAVGFNVG